MLDKEHRSFSEALKGQEDSLAIDQATVEQERRGGLTKHLRSWRKLNKGWPPKMWSSKVCRATYLKFRRLLRQLRSAMFVGNQAWLYGYTKNLEWMRDHVLENHQADSRVVEAHLRALNPCDLPCTLGKDMIFNTFPLDSDALNLDPNGLELDLNAPKPNHDAPAP